MKNLLINKIKNLLKDTISTPICSEIRELNQLQFKDKGNRERYEFDILDTRSDYKLASKFTQYYSSGFKN